MLYTILFLVRFFPFWALPTAFVFFEVGMFFYNRRKRSGWVMGFGGAFFFVFFSLLWAIFEGYWRFAPWIKNTWESFLN